MEQTLIVTAHPDLAGEIYEVLQAPFDLGELVDRVPQRLEGAGTPRPRPRPSLRWPGGASDGDTDCPEPVELILYVRSRTPSIPGPGDVTNVLERFKFARVKLTVCDLSASPNVESEAPVRLTPAEVRTAPAPRTFILGHITNPELLLELLADCDADLN